APDAAGTLAIDHAGCAVTAAIGARGACHSAVRRERDIGLRCGRRRSRRRPSLDFGDARPDAIGAAVGDDADAIGRVRRERDGPLHQVVAAYAAERHPGAAIPPLYL